MVNRTDSVNILNEFDVLTFEILVKPLIFEVILFTLDVERKWQSIVDIFVIAAIGIVVSHVYEQRLLVI